MTGSLVKDIARQSQREPMTISEAVIKIESWMEKDIQLARRTGDMRNNLMKKGKKNYRITVAPLALFIEKPLKLTGWKEIFSGRQEWYNNSCQPLGKLNVT